MDIQSVGTQKKKKISNHFKAPPPLLLMGGHPLSLSLFLLFLLVLPLQLLAWTQPATNVEDSNRGCSAGTAATGSGGPAATGSGGPTATGSGGPAATGSGSPAGKSQKRRSEDVGQLKCSGKQMYLINILQYVCAFPLNF